MRRGVPTAARAFLLLEMVLALTVFAMATTGFVVALHRMSKTASQAQAELRVTRVLESALNETVSLPVLEPGEMTTMVEGEGFELLTQIEPLEELQNLDGVELEELFVIRITARWYENGNWHERQVETWRYGRMYQP